MKDYNKAALFEFYKIKQNSSFKFTSELEYALQVSKPCNSNYKIRDIIKIPILSYKGTSSSSSLEKLLQVIHHRFSPIAQVART